MDETQATPAAPAAPSVTVAPAAPTYSTPATTSSTSNGQLQQALNQKMEQTPEPAPSSTASTKAAPVLPSASLPAIVGPPSPLPAAKQQKLDVLLQQYRMDQITPEQYHEQRAKILSEQ
jgi:hypothetical protein